MLILRQESTVKEQIYLFYFLPGVKSFECDSVKVPLSDMTRWWVNKKKSDNF